MFIWRADTAETDKAFKAAKTELDAFLKEAEISSAFELASDNSGIRCVEWEGVGSRAFYFVNMGQKPVESTRLRIRTNRPSGVRVYADVKEVEVAHEYSDGWVMITLPGFSTSCIVRLETEN